jgi:DNA-binding Lrp family transcriptional regulator
VSHIKKLTTCGVIENFSIIINSEKVGFKRFLLRLSFVHYKKIDLIIQYFSRISYVEEINKVIGEYHLEITLHTNTLEHFHAILEDFRTKYSNEIKDYDYFIISKVHTNSCESTIFK